MRAQLLGTAEGTATRWRASELRVVAAVIVVTMLAMPQGAIGGDQTDDPATALRDGIAQRDIFRVKRELDRAKAAGVRVAPFVAQISGVGDELYDEANRDEGAQWYRLAADEGGAAAQVSVGYADLAGIGMERPQPEQALKWFRIGAARNDPWAFAGLATMYREGLGGLEPSASIADDYERRAAHAGVDINRPREVSADRSGTSIHEAVRNGDRSAIASFDKLDEIDLSGNTPLTLAVGERKQDIVQLLLERGAKPDAKNRGGDTPLLIALEADDSGIVRMLLSRGASPSIQGARGRLPLHLALLQGMPEAIDRLLATKADPNQPGIGGMTAVHAAVLGIYPEGLKPIAFRVADEVMNMPPLSTLGRLGNLNAVLENGGDANRSDDQGVTPLMAAVQFTGIAMQRKAPEGKDLLDAVETILRRGADVNRVTTEGKTALMIASESGCSPCVSKLLSHGAHLDDQDAAGQTALSSALSQRARIGSAFKRLMAGSDVPEDLPTIETLLRAGADPLVEDGMGLSAVDYAAWELPSRKARASQEKLAIALLVSQATSQAAEIRRRLNNVRLQQKLFLAISRGDVPRSKMLSKSGASLSRSTPEGLTPIFFAVRSGHREMVRWLLDGGAAVTSESEHGVTPLMLAADLGEAAIVQDLLTANSEPRKTDVAGRTALHLAVRAIARSSYRSGKSGISKEYLLDDPQSRNADEFLLHASSESRLLPLLLDEVKTSAMSERDPAVDSTPASRALVVDALLNAGADPWIRDRHDASPLNIACDSKSWQTVQQLRRGTLPAKQAACVLDAIVTLGTSDALADAILKLKETGPIDAAISAEAMGLAIELNRADMLTTLLDAFDTNGRIADGTTPLTRAVDMGRVDMALSLLAKGADPNAQGRYGLLMRDEGGPLHIALDPDDSPRLGIMPSDPSRKERAPSVDLVEALLDAGASIDAFSADGRTPLMVAAERMDLDHVRLLLERGADVTSKDSEKGTAMGRAIVKEPKDSRERQRQSAIIRLLHSEGCSVNASTGYKRATPLIVAAGRGDLNEVVELLDLGAKINWQDSDKMTALNAAATAGHLDVVRALISRGAALDVEYVGYFFSPSGAALERAISNGHTLVALALIDAGANVDQASGWTPLQSASREGDVQVVDVLLKKGASTKSRTVNGSPIFLAAEFAGGRGDKVLSSLLAAGASPNERNEEGMTALHVLAAKRYVDYDDLRSARLLLDHGVAIDAKNNDGRTALHLAAGAAHDVLGRELLNFGASVSARGKDGMTALMLALGARSFRGERERMVRYLLSAGSDVNAESAEGDTVLMQVVSNDELDAKEAADFLKQLIRHGAAVNAQSATGDTVLMHAVFVGGTAAVKELLNARAAVDDQNADGRTALMLAAAQGNDALVRMLLDAGATSTIRGRDGQDAAALAAASGHDTLARLIAKHRSHRQRSNRN